MTLEHRKQELWLARGEALPAPGGCADDSRYRQAPDLVAPVAAMA
jgi:hypothetical protein